MIFSKLKSDCSNLSDMRNLQEQVKKAFCYQQLFWPFTVGINCSSDWEKLLKFEVEMKAENLQNFWDHESNLFKQWKIKTIVGNRMLFWLVPACFSDLTN